MQRVTESKWDPFNATATRYNSTSWQEECESSKFCTNLSLFGYFCALLVIFFCAWVMSRIRKTVRKTRQITISGRTESEDGVNITNKESVKFSQLQMRYHYKLHLMVTLLLNDVVWVLLVLVGQFGRNLHTNFGAKLYAYGYVVMGATSHASYIIAQFNTRRTKLALKAIKNNQMMDKLREYDSSVVQAETRKYVILMSSVPVVLHIIWLVVVLPNNNLVS